MLKLNNKGFMMTELLIASVVILTVMVSLYTGFNKIYLNYSKYQKYSYTDGLYLLEPLRNILIDSNSLKTLDTSYLDLTANTSLEGHYKALWDSIIHDNNISRVLLIDITKLDSIKLEDNNINDYLTYLNSNVDSTGYSYILVGVFNQDKYASIKIK